MSLYNNDINKKIETKHNVINKYETSDEESDDIDILNQNCLK